MKTVTIITFCETLYVYQNNCCLEGRTYAAVMLHTSMNSKSTIYIYIYVNDSIYDFDLSISGNSSEKLHCWNVVNMPY